MNLRIVTFDIQALSQFGENYELISYVLPGRDRKSCKNKFKAEDKKNSNRITYCLNNRIPYGENFIARIIPIAFSLITLLYARYANAISAYWKGLFRPYT